MSASDTSARWGDTFLVAWTGPARLTDALTGRRVGPDLSAGFKVRLAFAVPFFAATRKSGDVTRATILRSIRRKTTSGAAASGVPTLPALLPASLALALLVCAIS